MKGSISGNRGDFAEYLVHHKEPRHLVLGDLVQLYQGKVTLTIIPGRGNLHIISSREQALLVGYTPRDGDTTGKALCAYVGQVLLNVEGDVAAGDELVPSGNHDGKAKRWNSLSAEATGQVLGYAMTDCDMETQQVMISMGGMSGYPSSPRSIRILKPLLHFDAELKMHGEQFVKGRGWVFDIIQR